MSALKKISDPRAKSRLRRKRNIRKRINGTPAKPRLSVFRSNTHIYAQAVDDTTNTVLASSSDLEKALKGDLQDKKKSCLLYTSPSPRDRQKSRMPSSA